jgi:hypothetical protein
VSLPLPADWKVGFLLPDLRLAIPGAGDETGKLMLRPLALFEKQRRGGKPLNLESGGLGIYMPGNHRDSDPSRRVREQILKSSPRDSELSRGLSLVPCALGY